MSVQPGLCPRFTGKRQVFSSEVSEQIMQDFAQEKKLDATFIKDLIQRCCTTLTLILTKWIKTCTNG